MCVWIYTFLNFTKAHGQMLADTELALHRLVNLFNQKLIIR